MLSGREACLAFMRSAGEKRHVSFASQRHRPSFHTVSGLSILVVFEADSAAAAAAHGVRAAVFPRMKLLRSQSSPCLRTIRSVVHATVPSQSTRTPIDCWSMIATLVACRSASA